MSVSIDSLQIEIQSSSANAEKGISDLAKALGELKSNGSIKVAVKNLGLLSEELGKFKDASNASRSIGKVAGAMKKLKEIGSVKSIANSISSLRTALDGVDNINVGNVAPKLKQLSDAVAPLSNIKAGGINTMANGLKKLDEVTQSLDDATIDRFADRIKKLNTVLEPLSTKMTTIKAGLSGVNSKFRSAGNSAKKMGEDVNSSALNLSSFIHILQTAAQAIQTAIQKFKEFMEQAIEWDGIAARFGRSFGSEAQETYDWIQRLNEEMGISAQTFMQYSSLYAQMLTGFGVASKDVGKMALGYTELTYDIWAAANDRYKTFQDAAEAVASAIAGEVEPIRRAGFTIVESTLEETAAYHGLSINIEKASEAQKSYLRYLTLVDQAHATGVIGTYARELNTAEGLMRTFSQQVKSLSQAFGSLFLPALVQVMPYLQAFVELLTEGVRAIADFFGIQIQEVDWNDYNAGLGTAVDNTDTLTDGAEDATKALKELKNATIGIDELNVISPPSASSGTGVGSEAGTGIFDGVDIDSLWDESIFKDINDQVDAIKEKFQDWLPVIATIGTALGGLAVLSLIDSIGESMEKLQKMDGLIGGLKRSLAQIAILTIEAAIVFMLSDEYLESGNLIALVGEALATAAGGYLMYKGFGAKGLAMAMIVSVVAQLAAITLNLADGGVEMSDPQLWIQSAFTTALGAAAGGWLAYKEIVKISTGKGIGLGALATLSLTLAAITIGETTANGELTAASVLTGLGSVVAAAGFGFTIGGVHGAAIAAGVALVANIAGIVVGKIASSAKTDLEKDLKDRFGEIELSGEALTVYVDSITAIPRSIVLDTSGTNESMTISVDAALDIYTTESISLDRIKESIESAVEKIDTNNVRIAIGVDVEQSEYEASINAFVSNAQGYLDQYYLTTSIALEILGSNEGLTTTLSAFYAESAESLTKLGADLKQTVSEAFVDGEWIPDKLNEAMEIQKEMQEILDLMADIEYEAKMENLSISVTGASLTPETFESAISQATGAIEDRLATLEEVKMSNLQVAVMEYRANIDAGMTESEAQRIRDEQVAAIEAEYQAAVVEVSFGTVDWGLSTLHDAFAEEMAQAKADGWFDYGKNLESVMNLPNAMQYVWDNGQGDVYAGIDMIATQMAGEIQFSLEAISPEARENLKGLLKQLEPTMADYNRIAAANRTAGDTVTENIRNGLNDYNQLKAMSGDVEAINYMIGKGFSTDPVFLNTLATVKGAGENIDASVAEGLLNNLDYVKDEASGTVIGIRDAISGKTIEVTPELVENMKSMGVDLSTGLATGLEEDKPSLLERFGNWCGDILEKIKNAFDINSPSGETEKFGKNLSDGFGVGMEKNGILNPLSDMWDAAKTWWDKKKSAMKAYTPEIGSIKDKVSSAWATAKAWYDGKKAKLKDYTPSIGSIYDVLKERWENARGWYDSKKTKLKEYTPTIGSIYEKVKERWDNAKTWYDKSKSAMKTYTPNIGDIKAAVQKAWNTAKSWWNKNVKLSIPSLSFKVTYSKPSGAVKKAIVNALGLDGWPKLSFAANGGMFDMGSLIWAGERGAEIVANAGGGKTGVMNVQQMSEAMYEAVYAAVIAANRGGGGGGGVQAVNVYLDGKQIAATVDKRNKERGASIMGNEVYSY